MSRRIIWGPFALLLCISFSTKAATINAASCSSAAVQAALNSVKADGTVVLIPSGTCTWTSGLTYTQAFSTTIQGASSVATTNAQGNPASFNDATKIIDGSTGGSPLFPLSTGPIGKVLRISGLSIQGASGGGVYNGELQIMGSGQFRIDHCHFININVLAIRVFVNGVADHNLFDVPTTTVWNGISVMRNNNGDLEWSQNTGFGTSDFVFIENNTFNNGFPNDCNQGGKYVARYNTLVTQGNSSFQEHATGSVNNPPWRGCRAYEVYGNVVSSTQNGGSFTVEYQPSSTGLSWGNTATGYTHLVAILIDRDQQQSNYTQVAPPSGWGYCGTFQTGLTSSWDGNLNNNGSNGWPCMDQPGRGKGDLLSTANFPTVVNTVLGGQAWPRQALEPVYSWMENFTPTPAGSSLFTVNSPNNNLQNNRDYYQQVSPFTGASGTGFGALSARPVTCAAGPGGNAPGVAYWATDTNTLYVCTAANTWTAYYTPYTYPHPLVSSSGTPPAPPTGLAAIVN